MGKLFWKFFFFLWLAQVTTAAAMGAMMWLHYHDNLVQQSHFGEFPGDSKKIVLHPPFEFAHQPPPKFLFPIMPVLTGIIVSLVFAALLAWYFAKPIRGLRNAFSAAANGDLDQKLTSIMGDRQDELADLCHDFDTMTQQLHRLMQGQQQLLHHVSHELRSPLARLHAIIGLIRQKPEHLSDMMGRLESESIRMETLVAELLTFSKLESGIEFKPKEEIAIDELIRDLVEDTKLEAESHDCKIVSTGNTAIFVNGNNELLYRAIENVMRNAIKYSPKNGTISIDVVTDPKETMVHIYVTDDGMGVQPHDIEFIFKPFMRGQNAREGYGLGLAIAQQVIAIHGGSITARNEVGRGLCVIMSLPVFTAHANS